MISIETLEKTILEHESKDTTYANCEKLAWLYIVRDHLANYEKTTETSSKEISTFSPPNYVLPSYNSYIEIKKEFQLGNISEDKVLQSLNNLSTEIKDFIKTIYRNTDIPEERNILNNLISDINVGNI